MTGACSDSPFCGSVDERSKSCDINQPFQPGARDKSLTLWGHDTGGGRGGDHAGHDDRGDGGGSFGLLRNNQT